MKITHYLTGLTLLMSGSLFAATEKPNILVIFGDDIGMWNISAYSHGMMGPKTPNIDRIALEGMMFTDHYAHPSCTAGRAAFLTGQYPIRTGLTTVGLPGSPLGLQKEDPTIAEVLKAAGYTTGQFGKNHLGDLDEHLPTAHGFDEFFGNLYHLNAEEEPEQLDWPGQWSPEFKETFSPRGVIRSYADGRIEDTGPLTRERMVTIDDEFVDAGLDFIERAHNEDKPWFTWINSSRMHVWTHLQEGSIERVARITSDEDLYGAGMLEHDDDIGRILDKLDELEIADNTLVIYTSDNGYEMVFWPDGGYAPFRGEKGTTWEGGVRVPFMVRWPEQIQARSISNGIQSHEDIFTTLAAVVGETNLAADLKKGHKIGDRTYKVHIDGVDNLDLWTGKTDESNRTSFFYYDESELTAIRVGPWKAHFGVKMSGLWFDTLEYPRIPMLFNLRMDPMERFGTLDHETGYIARWMMARNQWALAPMGGLVQQHLESFIEFPPRQEPTSFSIEKQMQAILKKIESQR
jgi:arylsulfatase